MPQRYIRILRPVLALCVATAVLSMTSGCSGARVQKLEEKLANTNDEVSELRRGQAAQRVQFDEFRNRLVMLQDKFDSARVQQSRALAAAVHPETPPALPHVVLPRTAIQIASEDGGSRLATLRRTGTNTPAPMPRAVIADDRPATRSVEIGPNGQIRVSGRKGMATKGSRGGKAKSLPKKSTAHVPAGPGANHNGPPPQTQSPQEQAAGAYRAAKARLDAGQLRAARDEFTAFMRDHREHPLADNALYWMGETYYAQSLWLRAARLFGQVLERYPQGNKVPDAMVKTGLCYLNLGERKLASDTFGQLRSMYPGTSAARIAAKQLTRIRSGK